jgi:nitrate reductase assembly molybdenum cofactor insertion protein NarJ
MSSRTLKQIAELNMLSIAKLEARWRKLFGWTSDILSPEHIFLGKRMRGEYIVRLIVRPRNESSLAVR